MFEAHTRPLLKWSAFLRRFLLSSLLGGLLISVSLTIGTLGYRYFEHLSWLDAFANAAMILSGMGPLTQLTTDGGKIFVSFFALYSGLAVVLITGITFAPVIHRVLHKFHCDMK